jgi:hypothetical protein
MPTTPTPITSARSVRTAPPLAHELEASLEAYFNRQVRLLGGRATKLAPTEKGVPDRLVLLPGGRMYLVELKTTKGRTSAAQDLWHERAAALGTRVQLLVGRAGIDKWLQAVGTQPGEKKDQLNPGTATATRGRGYASK